MFLTFLDSCHPVNVDILKMRVVSISSDFEFRDRNEIVDNKHEGTSTADYDEGNYELGRSARINYMML